MSPMPAFAESNSPSSPASPWVVASLPTASLSAKSNADRAAKPNKPAAADLAIPSPPLYVRSPSFVVIQRRVVRVRGVFALALDLRHHQVAVTGRIRVLNLTWWRVSLILGLAALGAALGGFGLGLWLATELVPLITPVAGPGVNNPFFAGLCAALGAFGCMVPAAAIGWWSLTCDLERFDIPPSEFHVTESGPGKWTVRLRGNQTWELALLPGQEAQAEKLLAALIQQPSAGAPASNPASP